MTLTSSIWDNEICKALNGFFILTRTSYHLGSAFASVQSPRQESLIHMSEPVVVPFLHTAAGFFFCCLLLFLCSSIFMIFPCPLSQYTPFPLSFLTQSCHWLLNWSPLEKIISVFSFFFHNLFLLPSYRLYYRHSWAAFLCTWIWPLLRLHIFLEARPPHAGLLHGPRFFAVLPFALVVFSTSENGKFLGDRDQIFYFSMVP